MIHLVGGGRTAPTADMQEPLQYAEPTTPRPLPPLWQRLMAWTSIGIAAALVILLILLYTWMLTDDLRRVLFMPH